MRKLIVLSLIGALLACTEPAQPPAAQAQPASGAIRGVVTEVIDVENYLYLNVKTQSGNDWIATGPAEVTDGDVVSVSNGVPMESFRSTTLDRTFDKILFVDRIEVDGASSEPSPAPTAMAALPPGHPQLPAEVAAAPAMAPQIQPLEGGMTVAEIYGAYPDIEGQAVSLRASVLKFSPGIMGSNWATLQDGSGIAPDNVLVVKTAETVDIGETVAVSGTARIDVSLGYGYDYRILLGDASFTR